MYQWLQPSSLESLSEQSHLLALVKESFFKDAMEPEYVENDVSFDFKSYLQPIQDKFIRKKSLIGKR